MTTFVDNSTPAISAAWLNGVDTIKEGLGNPADLPAIKSALHAAPGAIGGTTPATGAFTTLGASSTFSCTGAATFSSTINVTSTVTAGGQILSSAGSASAPGVAGSADVNTGVVFNGSDILSFATNGTEVGRLIATGYAKFAPSGSYPVTTTGAGHEFSHAASTFTFHVSNSHASSPEGMKIKFTAAAPNGTSEYFLQCIDSSADRLYIFSNGNVQNTNNSYGAISDERLKTNIVDAPSQWEDIKALRVRKYQLTSDTDLKQHIGLVAQEVQKVSPGLVTANENGVLGVQYSVQNVKLLKAFQEAQERIEALEKAVGLK